MFVFVMDADSRDKLVAAGYRLLRVDERNGVWVFENKDADMLEFSLDIPCVISNTMTF